MKTIGLLLIVILSTALGASLYDRDRKKVLTFSLLCTVVDEIYSGIRYNGATVEELLVSCAENPLYSPLCFLKQIKTEIQENGMNQNTVKKSILDSLSDMGMSREEMLPFLNMAEKLGTTDATGQLLMLENCKLQLCELKHVQNRRCETLGKMYISLGLLFGIGTAVILA